MRHCECGRQLEKWCDYCSECGYVNRQISHDIAQHNYLNSKHGKSKVAEYESSERRKQLNRIKMTTDKRREYKRKLYRESVTI